MRTVFRVALVAIVLSVVSCESNPPPPAQGQGTNAPQDPPPAVKKRGGAVMG